MPKGVYERKPKPLVYEDLVRRFWEKVDLNGPVSPQDGTRCWLWTGAQDGRGYGQFWRREHVRAHRFSYELHVGPPGDAHLDHRHTCPKHCVNPDHLRPTTPSQNLQNRAGPTRVSTTGVRGVTWNKNAQKYMAYCRHLGVWHYGGLHADLASAEQAAIELRRRVFTHSDADGQHAAEQDFTPL